MAIITLSPGLNQLKWEGPDTSVSSLPFKSSLPLVYKINSAKLGWQSGIPDDANSIVQTLVTGITYLFKVSQSFTVTVPDNPGNIPVKVETLDFSISDSNLVTELEYAVVSKYRQQVAVPIFYQGTGIMEVKNGSGMWVSVTDYNTYISTLSDTVIATDKQVMEFRLTRPNTSTVTGQITVTPL